MNCTHTLKVLLPTLLLTACGTKYSTTQPDASPTEVPAEVPAEPVRPQINPTTITAPVQSVQSLPAAVALRDQAAVATSANDHARAKGLLERALRISPNDPQTFYDLALSHLAVQQPLQALQLAKRGLTLNPTNEQRQALNQLTSRSEAML